MRESDQCDAVVLLWLVEISIICPHPFPPQGEGAQQNGGECRLSFQTDLDSDLNSSFHRSYNSEQIT